MATEFFTILIMRRVSNQSILSLRLASTTADPKPYPFGSGIEEQISILPGRIQVPVPALITIPLKANTLPPDTDFEFANQ